MELTNQGRKLEILELVSVMNKTSLNYTWRTCGNKWWLGNHIITIHLHGFLFKVNNNQLMEISQNQIMKCIICQNDTVSLEILAMLGHAHYM